MQFKMKLENGLLGGKGTLLGYDFDTKRAVPLTKEIKQKLDDHLKGPESVPLFREASN
jgi:acyl-CoA thioester hydrolase